MLLRATVELEQPAVQVDFGVTVELLALLCAVALAGFAIGVFTEPFQCQYYFPASISVSALRNRSVAPISIIAL